MARLVRVSFTILAGRWTARSGRLFPPALGVVGVVAFDDFLRALYLDVVAGVELEVTKVHVKLAKLASSCRSIKFMTLSNVRNARKP